MAAAAVDFAQYSNELAIALHASGRRLGLDLSGDQGSPIDDFAAFGIHAPAVDYFTLMATYNYYDSIEKNGAHYNDRLMVTRALAGGIPAEKLACGISSETVKFPNKTGWNHSTLGAFEEWITSLGVGGLDVWRTDIDVTWPIDKTEPWFLAILDKFIAGGSQTAMVQVKSDDDDDDDTVRAMTIAGDVRLYGADPAPGNDGTHEHRASSVTLDLIILVGMIFLHHIIHITPCVFVCRHNRDAAGAGQLL
jgi:hypothetical protein